MKKIGKVTKKKPKILIGWKKLTKKQVEQGRSSAYQYVL